MEQQFQAVITLASQTSNRAHKLYDTLVTEQLLKIPIQQHVPGSELLSFTVVSDTQPPTLSVLCAKQLITGTLMIPEEVNGYKITHLGEGCFQNQKYMTCLIIPHIQVLEKKCLQNCDSLCNIILPFNQFKAHHNTGKRDLILKSAEQFVNNKKDKAILYQLAWLLYNTYKYPENGMSKTIRQALEHVPERQYGINPQTTRTPQTQHSISLHLDDLASWQFEKQFQEQQNAKTSGRNISENQKRPAIIKNTSEE